MSATKPAEKPHKKDDQAPLREQLIALLSGGQAHTTFDEAVKDLPIKLRGTVSTKSPVLRLAAPRTSPHRPTRHHQLLRATNRWLSAFGVAPRLLA